MKASQRLALWMCRRGVVHLVRAQTKQRWQVAGSPADHSVHLGAKVNSFCPSLRLLSQLTARCRRFVPLPAVNKGRRFAQSPQLSSSLVAGGYGYRIAQQRIPEAGQRFRSIKMYVETVNYEVILVAAAMEGRSGAVLFS